MQIAVELDCSDNNVRQRLTAIYHKLDLVDKQTPRWRQRRAIWLFFTGEALGGTKNG